MTDPKPHEDVHVAAAEPLRQHVMSRTAREYYRAGAPESTSRTPASSTPPDEILPASFPFFLFVYFREFACVRVWEGSACFWALPRTYGTDARPIRGVLAHFGPKTP